MNKLEELEVALKQMQEVGFKLNEHKMMSDQATISIQSYENLLDYTISLITSIKDVVEIVNHITNESTIKDFDSVFDNYLENVKSEYSIEQLPEEIEMLLRKSFFLGAEELQNFCKQTLNFVPSK